MECEKLEVELGQSETAFPGEVLGRNDVLVPDDVLCGVERHAVQLFQLRDASFVP